MTETLRGAYERGVEDGKIAIRLDHHDDQIAATQVLLARTVEISQTMASTVQTLTEARVTDAATRIATAEAVKDAKIQQEAQAQSSWSPAAKLLTTIVTVVAVVSVVWAVLVSIPNI